MTNSTAQHSTAQHSTAQHSTAQHSTAQLRLRPASLDDAEMLLQWRNDVSTREASHNTTPINMGEHVQWLKKTLANGSRKLYVVEVDGVPVGTVRADHEGSGCELSWTVAPTKRGLGLGKKMVSHLAEMISEPIRAEIKDGNMASVHIAEAAGMVFIRKENGVLHYWRDTVAQPIIPPDAAR